MIHVACFLLLLAGAGPPPKDADPLDTMLHQARAVQKNDLAAWLNYRFHRGTINEWLDDEGNVDERSDLEYKVTPTATGFDEELVQIDGRTPTPREVESRRRAGNFEKHYRTFLGGGGEEDHRGYSLADLLNMSAYRDAGPEVVDGIPCERMEFQPGPAEKTSGLAGRFLRVMSGTLWITRDGSHLRRASVRTIKPVPIFLGIIRIRELAPEYETAPVGDDTWLPSRIDLHVRMSVLGIPLRRRTIVLTYSEFERVDPR
jgi:hypothetical protein